MPSKSVSWKFPEIGPIPFQRSYLKQVKFTSPRMAFQIFQVDSLLKHPFPYPTTSAPQPFPVWQSFQSLSLILFLPPEHTAVCLYLLLKDMPRTDEILHRKSSQILGYQN